MTTPAADEDEFTELTDADFPRVDLVKRAANGSEGFAVIKQQADGALFDPGTVRDLIAKAETPDSSGRERVTMPTGVTLSGSPADIAAFIHKAAQRADPDDVAKAEMSSKSINDLPDSAFAYIESGGKKDADGKTTPRSKRHFPVHDKAHADNAAARIAQGAKFGKEAAPKVHAAQRKFGEKVSKETAVAGAVTKDMGPELDDGVDGMDPTVPLAAPDEDAPGDPTDPGSPAWEAIDAATACKWASILSRARVALDLLGEREMLEAASADPDDMDNAFDMQDACCAIDYVISVLAPYAVAEQSEADTGGDDLMAAVGKAMAGFDPAPLGVIEALGMVRKAGRVLSASNEAAIRSAADSLQKVLTSLPQAPVADEVSKEAPMAAGKAVTDPAEDTAQVAKEGAAPEAQAADTGPVNAGGTSGLGEPRTTGPDGALPADGPQASLPGDAQVPGRQVVKGAEGLQVAVYDAAGSVVLVNPAAILTRVAKADAAPAADSGDGDKTMQAVFDQDGNLIGIVDPADITPVSGAGKPKAADAPAEGDAKPASEGEPAKPADAADMTPAPSAEAGTPADAPADDDVTKASGEPAAAGDAGEKNTTQLADVLKGIVAEAVSAALEGRPAEDVAKQADVAGVAQKLEDALTRIAKMEELDAPPRVFTSGQVPPANQLRGQDQGAPPGTIDVAKAQERKRELYQAPDARRQNQVAKEMQGDAIAALSAIHAGRR